MYFYEKSLRAGIAALLCGLAVWLIFGGPQLRQVREYPVEFFESPPAVLRPTVPPETQPPEPQPPETVPPETVPTPLPSAGEIPVSYACGLRPDLQRLLEQPLPFSGTPAVLILSTHSTESYRKNGERYAESAAFRTLDPEYNMISIGTRVAQILEQRGVTVIQDTSFHDYPSYNGSYNHARRTIASNLTEHPEIGLVLDLHRDATDGSTGQLRTRAKVNGADSAQLMLVMGTNSGGLKHDTWEENLAIALKLQVRLEALAPGITRPISLRAQRFNQDLCPGALLVEVGAAGNTRQEALTAAEVLAEAIAGMVNSGQ